MNETLREREKARVNRRKQVKRRRREIVREKEIERNIQKVCIVYCKKHQNETFFKFDDTSKV